MKESVRPGLCRKARCEAMTAGGTEVCVNAARNQSLFQFPSRESEKRFRGGFPFSPYLRFSAARNGR